MASGGGVSGGGSGSGSGVGSGSGSDGGGGGGGSTRSTRSSRSSRSSRTVFVTVGTTSFDALLLAVCSDTALRNLAAIGVTQVVVQYGRGEWPPACKGMPALGSTVHGVKVTPHTHAHTVMVVPLCHSHMGVRMTQPVCYACVCVCVCVRVRVTFFVVCTCA